MKKTLSVIFALLLLTATAARAQFGYLTNVGGLTITITNYTGPAGPVTIPATITGLPVSIGNNAFSGAGLTSVTIADGVISIGDSAFYNCGSLTGVTIPGSVTSIGQYAFYNCTNLTIDSIADGLTNIGNYAFYNCGNLASVTIPGSVISIGYGAFSYCIGLTSVTIANGVTNIGDSAFYDCTSLTTVTIPSSVTSNGDYAFFDCTNLTSVYFKGNAPTFGSSLFLNDTDVTVYYLPGATNWPLFISPGVPAVLWNPLIQTGDGGFGVRSNQFGFDITGTTNIPIVVEACVNLANPVWTRLQSLTLTNGLFHFSEARQTNSSGRYYRISSP
jgi:hypothetical protein